MIEKRKLGQDNVNVGALARHHVRRLLAAAPISSSLCCPVYPFAADGRSPEAGPAHRAHRGAPASAAVVAPGTFTVLGRIDRLAPRGRGLAESGRSHAFPVDKPRRFPGRRP